MPDVAASALEHFMIMVSDGTTNKLDNVDEASEVIEVTQMFDIDAANYSVVSNQDGDTVTVKKEPEPQVIIEEDLNEEIERPVHQIEYNATNKFGKRLRRKSPLLEHMGMVHKKVNVTLIDRGLEPVQSKRLDAEIQGKEIMDQKVLLSKQTVSQIPITRSVKEKLLEENEDEPEEQEVVDELVRSKEHVDPSFEPKEPSTMFKKDPVMLTCAPDMLDNAHNEEEYYDPLDNNIHDKMYLNRANVPEPDDENDTTFGGKMENQIEENIIVISSMVETCQICKKEVQKRRVLQHYTGHCMQGIKSKFGHLLDFASLKCNLCEAKIKKKASLIVHMGMVHLKVNEILVEQGFSPVQRDVRPASSNAKEHREIERNGENKIKETETYIEMEKNVEDSNNEIPNEVNEEIAIKTDNDITMGNCVKDDDDNTIKDAVTPILCLICRCVTLQVGDLWDHYKSTHYSKTIEDDHTDLSTGLACRKCNKSLGNENTLFMHIGVCYDIL